MRTSKIIESQEGFVVELIENNTVIERRNVSGKSKRYAEDLAENWETGVLNLLTE